MWGRWPGAQTWEPHASERTCWAFLVGLTIGSFKRLCGCGSRLSPGRPMRVEWRMATASVKYCLDFVLFFLLIG